MLIINAVLAIVQVIAIACVVETQRTASRQIDENLAQIEELKSWMEDSYVQRLMHEINNDPIKYEEERTTVHEAVVNAMEVWYRRTRSGEAEQIEKAMEKDIETERRLKALKRAAEDMIREVSV